MKKNILIALLTVLAVAVIVTILNSDKDTTQKEEVVQLPATVFDATATVPGTRLAFSYPSNGFYGLGAEIVRDETERSFGLEPDSPYVVEKGSQFVVMRIGTQNLPDEQTSLEDFVSSIDPNTIIGGYIKFNGEYREINGMRFFLTEVSEDAVVWHAWTRVDDEIITITLAYTGSVGAESQAALLNNDQLFLEILKTIRLQ